MREKKEYKPVQSIERIFQVLEVLAMNPEGLSLLSLSEKTGLPSSTVHRLLHTLYALGYTEWRGNNSAPYKLTLRLFEYGCHSLEDRPFIQSVHPFLERLAKELETSVYLYVPDGSDVLAAVKCGVYSTQGEPPVGSRIPMYCCSAGQCILSCYTEEEVTKIWPSFHLIPYTPNTIQTFSALENALAKSRRNGFSFVEEEYIIGITSLSIPLLNTSGIPFGALTAISPAQQGIYQTSEHRFQLMKQYAESIQAIYPGVL